MILIYCLTTLFGQRYVTYYKQINKFHACKKNGTESPKRQDTKGPSPLLGVHHVVQDEILNKMP